jgi:hypothetical protein
MSPVQTTAPGVGNPYTDAHDVRGDIRKMIADRE